MHHVVLSHGTILVGDRSCAAPRWSVWERVITLLGSLRDGEVRSSDHVDVVDLHAFTGMMLSNPRLDDVPWGDQYPLSVNHKTVSGIIRVNDLDAGDAVVLDQYVIRSQPEWPAVFGGVHDLEKLAYTLDVEGRRGTLEWDASVFERLFTETPQSQIVGFSSVASAVLSLMQYPEFRGYVEGIAADDHCDAVDVLRSVARTLGEAWRAQ